MSEASEYAQEIIDAYPRLLVENYCIIASSALLWFDFVLTLPDEYRRIWSRKFTGATLVYLLMRYVAVIERIFFVLEVLVWNSSDRTYGSAPLSSCGGITHSDDALLFINYLSFAAFTSLRVYGVWGRDWKPLLFVLPLSLIKPIVVMYENTQYIPAQAGPPFGCVYLYLLPPPVISKHPISITAKATTIAADGALIVLTWIKTFGISKDSKKIGFKTPLTTVLLRDGTAYFLVLLVIQIITIISNEIGSSLTIWLVWPYFDQVITVIFFSRFMLSLRGIYFTGRQGRDADTTLHLSDVKFEGITSTVLGNLGATLTTTLSISVPPHSPRSSDMEPSPAGSSDSLEGSGTGAYAWEWCDEQVEYSDDPFRAGLTQPEKPPALVPVVQEEQPLEMAEVEKDGSEIQEETRLGDLPLV